MELWSDGGEPDGLTGEILRYAQCDNILGVILTKEGSAFNRVVHSVYL